MPLEVTMGETSDSYLHEPDEWIAGQIVDIQVAPDTGYGPGFKWVITLDDQKEGDFDQWAFCSQILSVKSKLYGWLTALDPDNIPTPGTKIDMTKYIGQRCQVMFSRSQREDGTAGERVVRIRAEKGGKAVTRTETDLEKKQAQAAAAKKQIADDEAPF